MSPNDYRKLLYDFELAKHRFSVILRLLDSGASTDDIGSLISTYIKSYEVVKFNERNYRNTKERQTQISNVTEKILFTLANGPMQSGNLRKLVSPNSNDDFRCSIEILIGTERIERSGGSYQTFYKLRKVS